MPRREDIHKILLIGSGPIVIGQAAEFDYSGVQACKVLLEEGYEVVLVNSNPATIMTDPEFATATYIEPLLPGPVTKIIEKERPDALLPTLGGQTALNLAMTLHEDGTLERFGVEMIGADSAAIRRAEDREEFRTTMTEAGLRIPWSITVETLGEVEEALAADRIALPAIVRPAFTMGGQGGGIGHTETELRQVVSEGLAASPINQVLVEESVIGWGEFELEVMRDRNDNVVIVCSIENIDPMGVHTGDSVTVAPAQTLTDPLYQELRDQAIKVIRAIGVETGGSNVQFAVNPESGEVVVIEMNPRVSRSSALASKATGFPIAKMAAKLAVGYALEEIPNDITRATPAAFEPTIDYVVTKVPRFAFEKFPGSDGRLSTFMQSVGEAMAIGRTFRESFAKAMRSRELDSSAEVPEGDEELLAALAIPCAERFDLILAAFGRGLGVDAVHERCLVDRWFLRELEALAREGDGSEGLLRTYKAVDTCAAEFEAATPYYYSAHERPGPGGVPPASEVRRGERESVVILGAGPNRIGQGIEFDYCCVHAAMTARELGRDAVMVNCNPETVSTDYDTSDRLYFEPLTAADVLAVCAQESPEGVIVQFGGQTPLKLARTLEEAGVPLLGTPVDAIDLAEDRGRFGALLRRLGIEHPPYGTALSAEEAEVIAAEVGFPLLVRPSYVLGGRAMEICYSTDDLRAYLAKHVKADQEHPLLLDRFLENAIEVDVDALGDGEQVWVAGIMQHVEEAGVHSGDSACVIPPLSLGEEMLDQIRATSEQIALELGVIGLINIQYAITGGKLYVIEANPRASRTVPFVSKAIGVPLAKMAARLMLGQKLADQELPEGPLDHVSVKEAVLPFARFAGADSVLGPEMKSTGEVMGIASDFPTAFGKAQAAAGVTLPESGSVFITVTDTDKPAATQLATRFHDLGFEVIATGGTAQAIERMGVPVTRINKLGEGSPHVLDLIRKRRCDLVINTPTGSGARADGYEIRSAAVRHGIPCVTTMTGATAAARAIAAGQEDAAPVRSIQEIHAGASAAAPAETREERLMGAPFGRRLCAVSANRASGGYRVFSLLDRAGPAPLPGQFYMLATDSHWEQRGGRPFLPRAISVAETAPAADGVRLDFLIEGVGPGTERLCELAEGERVWVTGPLGNAFAEPRQVRAGAAGAILVGGGIGIAPLALLRRHFAERNVPTRVLLGFRDEAHSGGLDDLFACCEVRLASEDGHAGHRGYVTDLLAAMLAGDDAGSAIVYSCGPPPMLEAVRSLCESNGVSYQLAEESPMACGFGACFGCAVPKADGGYMRLCVDGPVTSAGGVVVGGPRGAEDAQHPSTVGVSTATGPAGVRSVDFCGIELAHPVINASGTFDAIAARRVFGAALLEDFPFSAFVSKTITPEPRAGNAPRRIWETPAGMLNSIGLPNRGLEGFLAEDLPQLAELPVPLIVSVMATGRAEFARLVEAVGGREEVAAIELNVSCPNVHSGLIVGEQPSETEALLRALRPLCAKPLIVKLTPNVADPAAVALAAEQGGADAVSLINTLKASAIDAASGEPALAAGHGGLSGPAVRPIALQQLRAVRAACGLPAIGMGGICCGADAAEFIAAGASLVAVGTENFRDPRAGSRVAAELRASGSRTEQLASVLNLE